MQSVMCCLVFEGVGFVVCVAIRVEGVRVSFGFAVFLMFEFVLDRVEFVDRRISFTSWN